MRKKIEFNALPVSLRNVIVKSETHLSYPGSTCSMPAIDLSFLPSVFKVVEVNHLSHVYRGIGVRNVNKGMEFYCPWFYDRPFTVGTPGVVRVPKATGFKSRHCLLFYDILDLMAYTTLFGSKSYNHVECDCIILNNVSNFVQFMLDCDDYDKIQCMLPDNSIGHTIYMTLHERNPRVVKRDQEYESFVTVYDYLLSRVKTGCNSNG